ncbi:MAG: hypothetical protein GY929_09060 [Actinomycetia bacterium]|nr:hypothetical protein [Actinomycetes bacterium]
MTIQHIAAAMVAPWPEGHNAHDRLLLVELANQANEGGWTWVGAERLGLVTNVGTRHIRRRIEQHLEVIGWVKRFTRPGRSNAYRVILPNYQNSDEPSYFDAIPGVVLDTHPQIVYGSGDNNGGGPPEPPPGGGSPDSQPGGSPDSHRPLTTQDDPTGAPERDAVERQSVADSLAAARGHLVTPQLIPDIGAAASAEIWTKAQRNAKAKESAMLAAMRNED